MKKESFTTGVFYMLLSATGISLAGLLGKVGSSRFSLEALIFWRFFAAFIFCICILWAIGKLRPIFSFQNPKLQFLRAFFVLGSQYSFYYYIQHNSLLNGLVLLSLGPLFIPMIEGLIHRQKIGKSTWIGLGVSFIGMICVLQPNADILSSLSLIGMLAGLCQGCSQVVFGLNSKTERSELSILYLFFLCAGFSLLPYLAFETRPPTEPHSWVVFGIILGLGIASVLNQLARAEAYHHSSPSKLATFMYFSILLGGFFDWLVFGMVPNTLSLIGALLVITGGALKIYLRHIFLKKDPN